MGGSAAAPMPYQQVTTTEEMPKWKKQLLGFTPDAPEYSPFKALSRQAAAQARIIEGMTTKPSFDAMYKAYGVPVGTDLRPYAYAMKTGTSLPVNIPAPESVQNPKAAAAGGLMSLRRYAPGGNVKTLNATQAAAVKKISKAIEDGTVTQAQIDRLNKIETNTGRNVSPYTDKGTAKVVNPKVLKAVNSANTAYQTKQAADQLTPTLAQALTVQTPFFAGEEAAKRDTQYGGITNPIYQQALDQLRAASVAPETIGQGAGIMSQAAGRLLGQAGYTPQQIAAQRADVTGYDPAMAQAYGYQAAGMNAPTAAAVADYQAAQANAAQAARARDITGPTAQAYTYKASQMQAPEDIKALDYTAALAQAAQMGPVNDVLGQTYQAADIARTAREQGVTTAAPKSWTEAGVASQYMDPYMQNVVNIQKRESMRDYAKQLNALSKQAGAAKAFGGSRLAIERSEAARNQAMLLGDIQEKGLQQAYQSGMGQFTGEQQLSSQVGMANTAQINALKQQYMQMGLTEAQANQAAQNAARQFGAQSAQQAAMANQQAALTVGQANLSAAQQTALANQNAINQQRQSYVNNALQAATTSYGGKLTAAQQNMIADNAAQQFNAQNQTQISQANAQMNLAAQQSNQQADLSTNQLNAQLQQQTALANQNAINQQRQAYVNNSLQAAMQAYGGQLTAAQQNQIAANAAGQFNASNQQQISLANQASQNAAGQFLAGAQNQAGLQYAANQLTAATQNQQAGLTGQGLNLQALNQAGQMGQGLGSLGISTWGQQQNLPQLWGAAGQTTQNIAQQAATGAQQTAQNWLGGMANAYQAPVNLLTGTPGATGTKNISQLPG